MDVDAREVRVQCVIAAIMPRWHGHLLIKCIWQTGPEFHKPSRQTLAYGLSARNCCAKPTTLMCLSMVCFDELCLAYRT